MGPGHARRAPWGRAAAALWATIGIAAASLALHAVVTVAVAVLGGGGSTIPGTVSDRLGNNIVHLAVTTLTIAMVGWAAAALAGSVMRRVSPPAAPAREV
nr:hypothetical protein GCM10020063_076210 [Dactylosporangium thailandense]